ncbi:MULTISPECIES: MlaD family protein [Mycolicibacter]|uniref:MCE family protein n=1 Tax=Mycolicibacter kumamotonensis TaxID=354243 RepID=A0A7K3LCJ9_9MYCO|nr:MULTISPECIES: MlaD family protein [Mycolicibacter]NDJ90077.1 MCE family protein [Mycolicibacter kumamotonensis]RAV01823.1 mammalian cell entry protein [Mycolicibacter senuensis]
MAGSGMRHFCRVAAIALTGAMVMTAGAACGRPQERRSTEGYCAIMPDSVGLYVGNPVTRMGYPIGKITSINPRPTEVRVEFSVTERRPLPADVKAVTRSTSILADRSLELVGNADSGPNLGTGECIPLTRSWTPKSLSEVIGSATTFVNGINPDGSTNVADVVRQVDRAVHNNGAGVNQLLTTSSAVVDSPDQAISDIGSIITNLAQLTSALTDVRGPLKEVLLNAEQNMSDVAVTLDGGHHMVGGFIGLLKAAIDVEQNLGEEIQFMLDATSVSVRKLSAHAPWLANLMNPVPWWINTIANHYNNREFHITYRPPLYRIRTPNGLAQCGIMNAAMPGSCADVAGQPYAVDVALLQYVLSEANR